MAQKRHEKSQPCLGNIMSAGIQKKKRIKVDPVLKAELYPNLATNF